MMYFVNRHMFNVQPNRQRREMVKFCEQEVLALLLTVQEGIDDIHTLVDILREKAEQLNKKYPRQAPLKVENHFRNGEHILIKVGDDEYKDYVGTLSLTPVFGITNKKYFDELRERMQEGGEG